jgi:hypothetical protein
VSQVQDNAQKECASHTIPNIEQNNVTVSQVQDNAQKECASHTIPNIEQNNVTVSQVQDDAQKECASHTIPNTEQNNVTVSQVQDDAQKECVSHTIPNTEQSEGHNSEHNQSCSPDKKDSRNISTGEDRILTGTRENVCDKSLQDLFNLSSVEGDIISTSDNRPLTSTQISKPGPDAARNQVCDISDVHSSLTSVISKSADLSVDLAGFSKSKKAVEQNDEVSTSCGNKNEENGEMLETQAGKLVFCKPCDPKLLIRKQRNKNLIKNLKQKVDKQRDSELRESPSQCSVNDKKGDVSQHPVQDCSVVECSPQTPKELAHRNKISPSTLTKLKKFRKEESNVTSSDINHELEKNSSRSGICDHFSGREKEGVLSQSYDEKSHPQSKNIFKVNKDIVTSPEHSIDSVNSTFPEKSQPVDGKKSVSAPSWLTKVNSLKSSIFRLDCEDNDEIEDLNIDFDFNPSKKVKIG